MSCHVNNEKNAKNGRSAIYQKTPVSSSINDYFGRNDHHNNYAAFQTNYLSQIQIYRKKRNQVFLNEIYSSFMINSSPEMILDL